MNLESELKMAVGSSESGEPIEDGSESIESLQKALAKAKEQEVDLMEKIQSGVYSCQ